jgi:FeS assembly SUF system regulator
MSDKGLASAGQVADATHLSQPTVSKLLKALVRAGLVVSERGSHGGYALARSDDKISAAEIIDAIEGPVAITECSSAVGRCSLESTCQVGSAWQDINLSIRRALTEVSLADLQSRRIPMPSPRFRDDILGPATSR